MVDISDIILQPVMRYLCIANIIAQGFLCVTSFVGFSCFSMGLGNIVDFWVYGSFLKPHWVKVHHCKAKKSLLFLISKI